MFRSALRALPITHLASRLSGAEVPAFARTVACARLDAPFREGVAAICRSPGEVVLYAQLPPQPDLASVPLHWEVARDDAMQQRERYGMIVARPGTTLQIPLHALERGRAYWYRLWAGGHWSHTSVFHSSIRQHRDARARAPRPSVATPAALRAMRA